jgi:hypothetical protein
MPKDVYHFDDDGSISDRKPPRLRSASRSSLPLTSGAIPDNDTHKQAVALLREGIALKVKESEIKERLDEIRTELGTIAAAYDLSGFRNGLTGFEYYGWKSRESLKKDKLIALLSKYSVPVSELAGCYEAGEEFLSTRLFAFDLE